jgi:putative flippase GtrA
LIAVAAFWDDTEAHPRYMALMPLILQFVTFFGVGVAATVTDWGSFFLLTTFAGATSVVGALISYCLGGILSYLLNRRHTFETDRTHVQAGWRFASVMAVGFTLTGVFMYLFAERMGLNEMLSRMITTGIVFFWNFVAHKTWTFAEKQG